MKSNLEWEKWGERDPLYAVASWEGKARDNPSAWTDQEFYELGRSDWGDFLRQWEHYGVTQESCLEIGCGAGRITRQLATYFKGVTAVDVSEHQINYAKERISVPNIQFVLSDSMTLPIEDKSYGGVFSVHVFQHFESIHDALNVFREIHRILEDDGTIMIHLPLYTLPDTKISNVFPPLIALAKWVSDRKAAADRYHLRKGKWKPVMRRLRFDRNETLSQLEQIGFSDIEFRMFRTRSNMACHDFVFAKKATSAGSSKRAN